MYPVRTSSAESGRLIALEARRRGQRNAKATVVEKGQLRSVIGSLSWLVRVCRPDLNYQVARLQMAVCDPTVQDLTDANNLVKYAGRTREQGILYPAGIADFEDMMVLAVQDASYAQDFDLN